MTRFLHIADVHLGTNQYNSPNNTRKKDFFLAFKNVIDNHAIGKNVDFVIIAGDLFDKNRIDPNTLNQSIIVFNELKKHNIPVFAIEGNHDCQWGLDTVSWLQFLGENGYINFLKPDYKDQNMIFNDNNSDAPICGCYYFDDKIRIIGTQWFGANTANAIPKIADAITSMPEHPYTILMLHAGIEGYLAGYGTITKSSLEPLKSCTNYIALGHIHKHYIYDDWAYNPGCLEACCIPEFFDKHGALLVEIDNNNNTYIELIEEFTKREFIKINVDISRCMTADDAISKIESIVLKTTKKMDDKPVVELTIDGALEFKRSELQLDLARNIVITNLDALTVQLKYFAKPKEYAIGANLSVKNNRQEIEYTVIKDMLRSYSQNNEESAGTANAVINLKNMVLNAEENENILMYLKDNILKQSNHNENS